MTVPYLILASASPRRQELLRLVGVPFRVVPSSFDESTLDLWPPDKHVLDSSNAKAEDVAVGIEDGVVIGADTIVVADDQVLGKPTDEGDARRMLRMLSGRSHYVYTGICVVRRSGGVTDLVARDFVRTEVCFCSLSEAAIEAYVATGEPLDKAGAYGIQERASVLIEGIVGDYFNVVGLPVHRLSRLLADVGVPVLWCE
jgi:septum formation protein